MEDIKVHVSEDGRELLARLVDDAIERFWLVEHRVLGWEAQLRMLQELKTELFHAGT